MEQFLVFFQMVTGFNVFNWTFKVFGSTEWVINDESWIKLKLEIKFLLESDLRKN